jgi:hypothetical protein
MGFMGQKNQFSPFSELTARSINGAGLGRGAADIDVFLGERGGEFLFAPRLPSFSACSFSIRFSQRLRENRVRSRAVDVKPKGAAQ